MIEKIYPKHKYQEGDIVNIKYNPSSCVEEAAILNRWHEDNGKCYYEIQFHNGDNTYKLAMEESRIQSLKSRNPNIR